MATISYADTNRSMDITKIKTNRTEKKIKRSFVDTNFVGSQRNTSKGNEGMKLYHTVETCLPSTGGIPEVLISRKKEKEKSIHNLASIFIYPDI